MNIKWVPVLDALAEQNGCYETRVGSYRQRPHTLH